MNAVYALEYGPKTWMRPWSSRSYANDDVAYLPVSVDVHEDGDAFVISALMPGVKAEDLKVEVEGDTISLRGEMKSEPKEGEYLLRERYQGKLGRTLTLPTTLDPEKTEATLQSGVLTVRVAKSAAARRKVITVQGK